MNHRKNYWPLAISALLIASCAAPGQAPSIPAISTAAQPKAIVNYGPMQLTPETDMAIVLKFPGFKSNKYALLAFSSTINRIVAEVSGPSLVAPLTSTLYANQLQGDTAAFTFSNLPAGPVTVRINSYDVNGNVVSTATGSATIVPGQIAQLALTCELSKGGLNISFECEEPCTYTPAPSPTPTSIPTNSPSSIPSPTPTASPSSTPLPEPSASPSPLRSDGPWLSYVPTQPIECGFGPTPPPTDPDGTASISVGVSNYSSTNGVYSGEVTRPCEHWNFRRDDPDAWYERDFQGTVNLKSIYCSDFHGMAQYSTPIARITFKIQKPDGSWQEFDHVENKYYFWAWNQEIYTYTFQTPVAVKKVRIEFSGNPLGYGFTNLKFYGN